MPKVYIIAGVPGTGKSTIGRIVSRSMDAIFIDLPDVVKEKGLYTSYDPDTESYVVDLRRASNVIGSMIKIKREPVILSTHIIFKPRSCNVQRVVVLRKNPIELIKVLEDRGYPKKKVAENISAELIDSLYIEALKKFGKHKVSQLDVTNLDASTAAERLLKIILSKQFGDSIDWVSVLEKEGGLDFVLSYISKFNL